MDWPGAQDIADRLKKLVPPEILENEKGKEVPVAVQAQITQMTQMIEMLTNQLNQANKTIEQKEIERNSKERVEFAKMETDLKKEVMRQAADAVKHNQQISQTLLPASVQSVSQQTNELDAEQRRLMIERQRMNGRTPPMNQPAGGYQTPGQPPEEM
jgi:DNA-binding HxlR family transcriptional regulator